jgi:hypothetical protein
MHLAATWLVNSTYFLNGNQSIRLVHVPAYGHSVSFVNDHFGWQRQSSASTGKQYNGIYTRFCNEVGVKV